MKRSSFGILVLATCCTRVWAQSDAPAISANGTVNAADYSRAFAPGASITIFGVNLADASVSASTLPLPDSLGGTTVEMVDGDSITSLPLFFASGGQLNAQLPYGVTSPTVQIRVRTSAGASNMDSIALTLRAPRLFSVLEDGKSRAIVQSADGSLVSQANPLVSGANYTLYLNSMGATSPAALAGAAAGSGAAAQKIMDPVTVSVDGNPADVTYAGLAPGLAGLYQVNFQAPYNHVTGDVPFSVSVGDAISQNGVTVAVQPNGFYFVLTGGKLVNGQVKSNLSGLNAAVAFRHEDFTSWGLNGFRHWTTDLQLDNPTTPTAGLALTLKNRTVVVYDNNGIDTNTFGDYYDNSKKLVPDAQKAGLYTAYSMSNYLPSVFAGYFKLTAPTTFDQIIGYFDPNGTPELRFDPFDSNFRYRMNIWSNQPGREDLPKETGSFTGDVFSTDRTPGVFRFSFINISARRVFSDGASDPIAQMVYNLTTAVTLPAGEYWFAHDAAVPVRFSGDDASATRVTSDARNSDATGTRRSDVVIARPKARLSINH